MKTVKKTGKIVDNFKNFFFDQTIKILRITNIRYDEQVAFLKASALSFFFIVVCSAMIIFFIIPEFLATTLNPFDTIFYFRVIANGCMVVALAVLTLFYLIFKNFQLWLFGFNICISAYIVINHNFGEGGRILDGSTIDILPVIFYICMSYGSWFNVLFWIPAGFIIYLVSYIMDSNLISMEDYCTRNANNSVWHIILFIYLSPLYGYVTGLIIITSLRGIIKKNRTTLTLIEKSLLDFNLSKGNLSNILEKPAEKCTDWELSFKSIIKSLAVIKTFVPEDDDDPTEFSTHYISSSVSGSSSSTGSTSSSSVQPNNKIKKNKFEMENLSRSISYNLSLRDIVVGFISFNDLFANKDINIIHENLSKFYSIVYTNVKEYNGFVSQCSDNQVFVSFNSKKKIINPWKRATTCFANIQKCLARFKLNTTAIILDSKSSYLGYMKAGNRSNYCVLHENKDMFYKIKFSLKNQTETHLICDKFVLEEIKYNCSYKQINVINDLDIFKVDFDDNTNSNQEWLYSIKNSLVEKSEEKDKDLKILWNLYKSKKLEQAQAMLVELEEKYGHLDYISDLIQENSSK